MAGQENKNTSKGRMLFTDFDASHMRRASHAAMPVESPQASVLPSLEEIASRIDIAFEEDDVDSARDGDGNFRPSPPFRQTRTAEPERDAFETEETEFPSDEEDSYRFSPAPGYERDYVYPAFRTHIAAPAPHDADDGDSGEAVMDAADRPAASDGEAEDDFGTLDILAVVPPESAREKLGMGMRIKRRPELAPPDRPYGGLERVKDWFQPPEDVRTHTFPQAAEDLDEPPEAGNDNGFHDMPTATAFDSPELQALSIEELFAGLDLPFKSKPNRRPASSPPIESREDAEDLFAELDKAIAETAPHAAFYGKGRKKDVDGLGSDETTILVNPKIFEHMAETENDSERGKDTIHIVATSRTHSAAEKTPPSPADSRQAGEDDGAHFPGFPGEDAAHERFAEGNDIAFADGETTSDGPKPSSRGAVPPRKTSAVAVNDEEDAATAGPIEVDGHDDRNASGESDPELDASLSEAESDFDDYLPGEPDAEERTIAIPVLNDDDLIDYSNPEEQRKSQRSGSAGDKTEKETATEPGDAPDADPQDGAAVAVNPLDALAKLDAIGDFGDGGLDDEMQAMLAEDTEGGEAADEIPPAPPSAEEEPLPGGWRGVIAAIKKTAGRGIGKILPMEFVRRMSDMAAFRENWRFYCDLLAALIATASLAVIVSYFLWFR